MNDVTNETEIKPRFVDGEVLMAEDLNELHADIQSATEAIKNLNNTVGIGSLDDLPIDKDNLLSRVSELEYELTNTDSEDPTFADRVSELEDLLESNLGEAVQNTQTLSSRVAKIEDELDLPLSEGTTRAPFATRVSVLEEQVLGAEGSSANSLINRVTALETDSTNSNNIAANTENIKNINNAICGNDKLSYDNSSSLEARIARLESRVFIAEYNTNNPNNVNANAAILWSDKDLTSITLNPGQIYFKIPEAL
jgi:hypothetical protein